MYTLSSKFLSIYEIDVSHRLEGIQDLSLYMDLLTKKGKSWILGCICNCSLVSTVHTHLKHFYLSISVLMLYLGEVLECVFTLML